MADEKKVQELTEEQKQQIAELKKAVDEEATKLGEIFSQCWESEEFKAAFMEDPVAIFEEYGVNYDKNIEYKIIDSPEKTIVHVLPYANVKGAVKSYCDRLMSQVEDVDDGVGKQILLEGWSYQIYQNTETTHYLVIPICPENLTSEELEMINGGCIFFSAATFLFSVAVVFVECIAGATTVAAIAQAVALSEVVAAAGAITVVAVVTATFELTGAFVANGDLAVSGDSWSYEFFKDTLHLYDEPFIS